MSSEYLIVGTVDCGACVNAMTNIGQDNYTLVSPDVARKQLGLNIDRIPQIYRLTKQMVRIPSRDRIPSFENLRISSRDRMRENLRMSSRKHDEYENLRMLSRNRRAARHTMSPQNIDWDRMRQKREYEKSELEKSDLEKKEPEKLVCTCDQQHRSSDDKD